jgi:hypothetical protein
MTLLMFDIDGTLVHSAGVGGALQARAVRENRRVRWIPPTPS